LKKKVNVLLSEKSDWMKKEKALNDKIQSLEKQIQDKENTPFCDKKKPEGKNIEAEDLNKPDNYPDFSNGQAEVSVFHSTKKKTKKRALRK